MLHATTLGQFTIKLDGELIDLPSRFSQSLLAYLLSHHGQPLRREQLAGIFWPHVPESNARSSLRHALWQLRRALEPKGEARYLVTDDLSIQFKFQPGDWCDAVVLSSPGSSLDELQHQTAAYGGEFLPGFYEEWVILERENLRMVFERKMQRLLDEFANLGNWPAVQTQAERLLLHNPTIERAYSLLILALVAMGDRAGAAVVYQRCRNTLEQELGLPPSEQTQALFEQILNGENPAEIFSTIARLRYEVEVIQTNAQPSPGAPPYKGLQAYLESDQPLFAGRDALALKLVGHLEKNNFLAIIGASGSGKSSLARAGLGPAFRQAAARQGKVANVIAFLPSAQPLQSLAEAEALRSNTNGQSCLLIVDQFEELFNLCPDEAERAAFISELLALVKAPDQDGIQGCKIVITLRADYYGHCARYPALREQVAAHQEYIGTMSAAELRQAIEKPAQANDWHFEPGLVELLLREAGHESGRLPLLSHTLLELWKRRSGRTLTLAGYAAAGGLNTAIAQSAEAVYQKFSPAQQELGRRLLLRLVIVQDGDHETTPVLGTRRRAALHELCALAGSAADVTEADVEYVLNTLASARLVTIGPASAELAHEALIGEWPTLRGWLLADRQSLRIQRNLTEEAHTWAAFNKDEGELMRNARLAQANEWALTHNEEMTSLEREFLAASQAQAQRETVEKDTQRLRELRLAQRARRFLQALSVVLLLAVLISGGMAWFANQQRQSALVQASIGLAAAALQERENNPELAALLALAALEEYPYTSQAQRSLAEITQTTLPLRKLDFGKLSSYDLTCTNWSPDSQSFLCYGRNAAPGQDILTTWPLSGNEPNYSILVPAGLVGIFAWSPDGRTILAQHTNTGNWAEVNLLLVDLETAGSTLVEARSLFPGPFGWLAKSQVFYTAQQDGVQFWDLQAHQPLFRLPLTGDPLYNQRIMERLMEAWLTLAPDPAGMRLAIAMLDGTVQVVNLPGGETAFTLGPPNPAFEVQIRDLWNPLFEATQANRFSPRGMHWSEDGQKLAVIYDLIGLPSADFALVWDVQTQTVEFSLSTSGLNGLAWLPGGQQLLVFSPHAISIWDSSGERQRIPLSLSVPALSTDGQWLLDTHRLWSLSELPTTLPQRGVRDVEWSPDGLSLMSTLNVFEGSPENGLPHRLALPPLADGTPFVPVDVAWSPDGQRVVHTAGFEFTPFVRIVKAPNQEGATQKSLKTDLLHCNQATGYSNCLLFNTSVWSPDPAQPLIATNGIGLGTQTSAVILWNPDTGQVVQTIDPRNCLVDSLAFSPDGRFLAGSCGTLVNPENTAEPFAVQVWDVQTTSRSQVLAQPGEKPLVVSWSPNGTRLAVGYESGIVTLYDTSGWAPTFTFSSHDRRITSLDWSPDGKYVLSISGWYGEPSPAHIWNALTGDIIQSITLNYHSLSLGDWSPDGRWLAFTNMMIYRAWTDRDELIDYTKERFIARTLTPEERSLFGLGDSKTTANTAPSP